MLTDPCSRTVQQHALVSVGNTEELGDIGGGQAFDVAQHDYLALNVRQRRQDLANPMGQAVGDQLDRRPGPTMAPAVMSMLRQRRSAHRGRRRARRRCGARAPAVVRARFRRMWKSQVLNEDRPSKRSTPRTTASQVSCTTSSATERLATTVSASRKQPRLVHGDAARRRRPPRPPGDGQQARLRRPRARTLPRRCRRSSSTCHPVHRRVSLLQRPRLSGHATCTKRSSRRGCACEFVMSAKP